LLPDARDETGDACNEIAAPGKKREGAADRLEAASLWWSRAVEKPVPEEPTLVLNPRSDPDFVAYARSVIDEGPKTVSAYQERLRARYPRAVVHSRELTGEPYVIWYCYRDGRWQSG
jgi:hypothetical protein